MNGNNILTTFWELITILGGWSVIVFGLASWLGNILARRILQKEMEKINTKLESFKHELGIVKSAYEHHLDLVLDYYALFYKHYRSCQRAESAEAHRQIPHGEEIETRDEFLDDLKGFLSDWNEKEGRIRLLLPESLLDIHEEAVEKFNDFLRAVQRFTPDEEGHRRKTTAFESIERVKTNLEKGLRDFLRTESLLK